MTEHSLDLNELEARLGSHSIFSPSSSSMWFNCSGSLIPHLSYPDSVGIDAAEGTVAHGIAEEWLKTGIRPDYRIGTTEIVQEADQSFEISITETMLDYVQEYVDLCSCLPGDHFVETRVDFSDLTPLKNQRGTSDHAACQNGKLVISDLKYGQGERVDAFQNTQALLYAYGFFREYDEWYNFQTIVLRIIQPRLDHFDTWEITRDELLRWAERLKERAYAAWCTDAKRTPGLKQCRWCRVKPDCMAHTVFVESLCDGVFDDLDVTTDDMQRVSDEMEVGMFQIRPKPVGTMSTEQKAAILPYRKMVERWFAEIADDLEQRAINGEEVPGYKVVEGRSDRQIISEDKAVAHLTEMGVSRDKLFVTKMVGITAIEDAIRAAGYRRKDIPELLNPIVRKPKGAPTMVPVSDKRPIYDPGSVFSDLDEL